MASSRSTNRVADDERAGEDGDRAGDSRDDGQVGPPVVTGAAQREGGEVHQNSEFRIQNLESRI